MGRATPSTAARRKANRRGSTAEALAAPFLLSDAWTGVGVRTYPTHQHQVAELVLHRSGSGTMHLDTGGLSFGPGSVTFCPPGCAHSEHQESNREAIVVLQFRWPGKRPAGLERAWVSPALTDRWLEGEFLWLANAAARDGAGRRLEADLRLSAAIAHLLAGPVQAAAALVRSAGQLVTDAQAWIATHASQASVAAVARAMKTSPDHLNRRFQNERGYGPRTAIALARIDRAKLLLRESRLPLQAVAEAVGYATARHFCAVFRRLTGATPGNFRLSGNGRKALSNPLERHS